MKKLLVALAVAASLVFAPIAMAADRGVTSSHKNLVEIQWVDLDGEKFEFVMIQDDIRVVDRLKDQGSPDGMITGIKVADGTYRVFFQTMFGSYHIGFVTWDKLCKFVPGWGILKDLDVKMFQTALGFEDIYSYFEVEDIEVAKKLIRDLNAADLETYEGDM
jgi:hypothetical protein